MKPTPDLLLVFPPYWDASMPYLSVPTLAAYLRAHGARVEACDLNLASARALLSRERLETSLARAERVLAGDPGEETLAPEDRAAFRDNLEVCRSVWRAAGPELIAPFSPSAPLPRSVEGYTAFSRRLKWALQIASAPFHPLTLTPTSLEAPAILGRMSLVTGFVERDRPLPAGDLLADFAARNAPRGVPVLGISVTGPSQLLPALALARRYKQLAPDTFACIGGAEIPYIADSLRACPAPFRWVDAFVAGEGEIVLRDVVSAAREGRDPASVRGLFVLRDGRVEHTGPPDTLPITDLPPPDFEGFHPRGYLANDDAVALTFARGCSWSRCAFCTQFSSYDGYRAMSPAQVTAHVEAVSKQVPVRSITVNDENVTPARLLEIGSIVRARLPEARWFALARLTRQLADTGLTRELAAAGCAMLSLGLESADQDVLRLNRKGISARHVPEILRAIRAADIWVHLFVVFGLPGETAGSARRTLRFVQDHHALFDSMSAATFRLERGSVIASRPEDFGVTRLPVADDHCDLRLPFTSGAWLSEEEAGRCFDAMLAGLLGTEQCPIELNQLRGQFVLQLVRQQGAADLRAEMARRARQTSLARAMLERDDALYARFRATPLGESLFSASPASPGLAADPERSLFAPLDAPSLALLRLRSLGLPLDLIHELQAGADASTADVRATDTSAAGEAVDQVVLHLLATRLFQDSGALDGAAGGPARAAACFEPAR
jgi:hypothetical protein